MQLYVLPCNCPILRIFQSFTNSEVQKTLIKILLGIKRIVSKLNLRHFELDCVLNFDLEKHREMANPEATLEWPRFCYSGK